ncbi:MAG: hypothetical protein UMU75_04385 [Halomonas sp.]|nr:hypothetical protein [Halomonas sp.]
MKFITATLAALCLSIASITTAAASESVDQAMLDKLATASGMQTGQSRHEICAEFEQLARAVMTGRQNGVPMSEAIANAGNNKPARLIVEDAYDVSRYHTSQMKRRTVEEFSTQQYRTCYQALAK